MPQCFYDISFVNLALTLRIFCALFCKANPIVSSFLSSSCFVEYLWMKVSCLFLIEGNEAKLVPDIKCRPHDFDYDDRDADNVSSESPSLSCSLPRAECLEALAEKPLSYSESASAICRGSILNQVCVLWYSGDCLASAFHLFYFCS